MERVSKISEVPMMTVDEYEIVQNSIVYSFDWDRGYGFSGKVSAEVKAFRVISVNNASRHYRLRSAKGCEIEVHLSKQCADYYGSLSSIKKKISEKAGVDLKNCAGKLTEVENTQKAIKSALNKAMKLKASDIKEPKAVKIKQ